MNDFTNNDDCGRAVRGRPFTNGNRGRKPGSKNRATVVAQTLLEDEAHELLRRGIEAAKAGDSLMLKFFLSRIVPRDRPVKVDFSLTEYDMDPVAASKKVVDSVARAELTPNEGLAVMNIIEAHARIMNNVELDERFEQIERTLRDIQNTRR